MTKHDLYDKLGQLIKDLGYDPPNDGDPEEVWLPRLIAIFEDLKRRLVFTNEKQD
jgi:hypothetical protein